MRRIQLKTSINQRVATLRGGTVFETRLAERPTWRKALQNHFRSIYRPFSTIFPSRRPRQSPGKSGVRPFSARLAPLKNGENGKNGRAREKARRTPQRRTLPWSGERSLLSFGTTRCVEGRPAADPENVRTGTRAPTAASPSPCPRSGARPRASRPCRTPTKRAAPWRARRSSRSLRVRSASAPRRGRGR